MPRPRCSLIWRHQRAPLRYRSSFYLPSSPHMWSSPILDGEKTICTQTEASSIPMGSAVADPTLINSHLANNGCIHVRPHVLPQARHIANDSQGGGVPMSTNRTKWPVKGGAVGFQPGWFNGHQQALIYINLGEGTNPTNYSLVMQPMFGITGPSNELYPGSVCLPQVPLPANFTAVVGANATIQVIEAAQHGAALYSVCQALRKQSLHFLPY